MIRVEQLLARSARMFPAAVAIEDAERAVTWAELEAEVSELARALVGLGVGAGHRVVVLARNRVEYAALYFACASISAVLVPLNTRLLAHEVAGLVERSGARVIFADARIASPLAPSLPSNVRGVAFDEAVDGWLSPAELGASGPLPARADDTTAVAVQMYTSGTTGLPKGAMLTHANVVAITTAWLLELPVRGPEHTFLQVTPLCHVGAMLMLMSCVATSTRLILRDFAPAEIAEVLAHRGVTHTLLVPMMIRFLLDSLGDAKTAFPKLEVVVYGASPIPEAQLARAKERFGCAMLQGYGLTETGGVVTALRPADHARPELLASAGRPVLGVEIRVVDAAGVDANVGDIGEVVARGPNVFPGYHEMPEATAEAFADGWFRTGDLGRLDAEGYLFVVDRSKDMIIVGGENVYPREVEDVLREHELVSDVAVVGIPDDRWGEVVLALLVASRPVVDEDRDLVALMTHARARLARFKCPAKLAFIPEVPRNAAGKVLKQQLRAPYWAARERKV